MKFIWVAIIALIVQQQPVQNSKIILNTNKDDYIELNTDVITASCDHCHSRDEPFMLDLKGYTSSPKDFYIIVSALNPNDEGIQALFNAKKALKYINKLVAISNNIADSNNTNYNSVSELGKIYIFLASDEIKGAKRKTAKKLAPEVINVLVKGLKSNNKSIKEQSITYLYYIAQINSQYKLFDDITRTKILLNIKENIPLAKNFLLGTKFQEAYDEFLK